MSDDKKPITVSYDEWKDSIYIRGIAEKHGE